MNYFLLRLIPPRPTFPLDISEDEQAMMQEHFAYWNKILAKRKVIVYGPVMDPKGSYGIAVVDVENEAEARNIAENDPAFLSKFGFSIEIHPMPNVIIRQ
jgi:uncharacterized protein YciI